MFFRFFLQAKVMKAILKKLILTTKESNKTTMTLKTEAKVHMEAKVRVSMEAKVSIIEAKVHMYPQNA